MTDDRDATRWLLLIHQIPPKPDYLRVKIGRRLQRIGAVPVKSSVYVLPVRDESIEDFQWLRAEIIDAGGDASVCRAEFIDGLTNEQIESCFETPATLTTPRSPSLRAPHGRRYGVATRASDRRDLTTTSRASGSESGAERSCSTISTRSSPTSVRPGSAIVALVEKLVDSLSHDRLVRRRRFD